VINLAAPAQLFSANAHLDLHLHQKIHALSQVIIKLLMDHVSNALMAALNVKLMGITASNVPSAFPVTRKLVIPYVIYFLEDICI